MEALSVENFKAEGLWRPDQQLFIPSIATQGPTVVDFAHQHLAHTKGDWRGKPFRFREWQQRDLAAMLALRDDGLRKHRTLLYGTPRKAGKSELAAVLGTYFLVVDDEGGPEIYSCAGDREQAAIVWKRAEIMISLSPALSELIKPYPGAKVFEVPETGAVWKVLSAEAFTKEGLNPSTVLFDEVHVQPNRELWDTMLTAGGARRHPFMLGLTTAGVDQESLLYGLWQLGMQIVNGEVVDPAYYFKWYGLPEETTLDWQDPAVWAQVHPAYGDFFSAEYMAQMYKMLPGTVFRRYFTNQWVEAEESWLPPGAWDTCEDDTGWEFKRDAITFTGSDASTKLDSTAHVIGQWWGDEFRVKAEIWERPLKADGQPDEEWRVPHLEVEQYLRDLYHEHILEECSYDPQFLVRTAEVLRGEGLPMMEVPQSDARIVPATQATYELIMNGKLKHDGDPTFARHIAGAVASMARSGDGGWRLRKGRSKRKIDAAIALVLCVYAAMQHTTEAGIRLLGDDEDDEDTLVEEDDWNEEDDFSDEDDRALLS